MILSKMTWKDAEDNFDNSKIVLIPIGSVEQHGPIGPLGTDFFIPDNFAKELESLKKEERILLPVMPYGVCPYHMDFPGSIDIGFEGLYHVMKSITESLMMHGLKKFVFINGHGGNGPALDKAAYEIFEEGGLVAIVDWWVLAGELNNEWVGGHGAGQEASVMLGIDPASVDKTKFFPAKIGHLTDDLQNIHINSVKFREGTVRIIRSTRDVTSNGAYGGKDRSENASKELGKEIIEAVLKYMDDFIDEFANVDVS